METKSARLTPEKVRSYNARLEGPIKTLDFKPAVTLSPYLAYETLNDLHRSEAHRACQERVSKATEAEQHIKNIQQRQKMVQSVFDDPEVWHDKREAAGSEVAQLHLDIARARVRHHELAEVAEQKKRAYEELCGVLEEWQRDAEIDELAQAKERQK